MTRVLTVATWNIFAGRTWDGSRVDLGLPEAVLRPRARRIVGGPASDHRAVVVELEWR